MSDQNGNHETSNGTSGRFIPPRSTDERGRLLPITDEQRRSLIEEGNRTLDELAEMTDETDTPELWDEVLGNLGVDPATGRGLKSGDDGRKPTMIMLKAVVKDGKIELEAPSDWPEGTEVRIEPMKPAESIGIRDEDWPDTPEGIARLVAMMDQFEPLKMTEG